MLIQPSTGVQLLFIYSNLAEGIAVRAWQGSIDKLRDQFNVWYIGFTSFMIICVITTR